MMVLLKILPDRFYMYLDLNSNGSPYKYLSYMTVESNFRRYRPTSSFMYYQANNYCSLVLEVKE